jgi:hypothetical protein
VVKKLTKGEIVLKISFKMAKFGIVMKFHTKILSEIKSLLKIKSSGTEMTNIRKTYLEEKLKMLNEFMGPNQEK